MLELTLLILSSALFRIATNVTRVRLLCAPFVGVAPVVWLGRHRYTPMSIVTPVSVMRYRGQGGEIPVIWSVDTATAS